MKTSTILSWICIILIVALALHLSDTNTSISSISQQIESIPTHDPMIEQMWDKLNETDKRLDEIEGRLDELLRVFEVADTYTATAYTHVAVPGRADINGTGDGITASGLKVQEGVMAVDPAVIPLGAKVWVQDIGVLTAADTGGAIEGNKIDVFMNSRSAARSFGIRELKAIVLEGSE